MNIVSDDNMSVKKIDKDTILINELIRDYLQFNNYNKCMETFVAESGLNETPFLTRKFITD
jgi:hypothetical protein